jgi:hypothetical protein
MEILAYMWLFGFCVWLVITLVKIAIESVKGE